MGNFNKKQQEKLKGRIESYEGIKNKGAFKKPGSLNPHKQGGASAKSGRRRWADTR